MIVRSTLSKKIHLGVLYGNKGGIKMGNTDPHYAFVPTHGDETYPSHLSSSTTCRELAIQGSCLYLDSIISLQSGKIRSLNRLLSYHKVSGKIEIYLDPPPKMPLNVSPNCSRGPC
jgi:hypothetical protein